MDVFHALQVQSNLQSYKPMLRSCQKSRATATTEESAVGLALDAQTQISMTNPLPEEGCIRFSVDMLKVSICSSAILNLSLHVAESQLFGSNFKAH